MSSINIKEPGFETNYNPFLPEENSEENSIEIPFNPYIAQNQQERRSLPSRERVIQQLQISQEESDLTITPYSTGFHRASCVAERVNHYYEQRNSITESNLNHVLVDATLLTREFNDIIELINSINKGENEGAITAEMIEKTSRLSADTLEALNDLGFLKAGVSVPGFNALEKVMASVITIKEISEKSKKIVSYQKEIEEITKLGKSRSGDIRIQFLHSLINEQKNEVRLKSVQFAAHLGSISLEAVAICEILAKVGITAGKAKLTMGISLAILIVEQSIKKGPRLYHLIKHPRNREHEINKLKGGLSKFLSQVHTYPSKRRYNKGLDNFEKIKEHRLELLEISKKLNSYLEFVRETFEAEDCDFPLEEVVTTDEEMEDPDADKLNISKHIQRNIKALETLLEQLDDNVTLKSSVNEAMVMLTTLKKKAQIHEKEIQKSSRKFRTFQEDYSGEQAEVRKSLAKIIKINEKIAQSSILAQQEILEERMNNSESHINEAIRDEITHENPSFKNLLNYFNISEEDKGPEELQREVYERLVAV